MSAIIIIMAVALVAIAATAIVRALHVRAVRKAMAMNDAQLESEAMFEICYGNRESIFHKEIERRGRLRKRLLSATN